MTAIDSPPTARYLPLDCQRFTPSAECCTGVPPADVRVTCSEDDPALEPGFTEDDCPCKPGRVSCGEVATGRRPKAVSRPYWLLKDRYPTG